MSTDSATGSRTARSERAVPAYGPVDAALGYALFYVLVDRATPTVVAVTTETLPDVQPALVRLGLAMALWFVLVVTVVEQVRRQLAAFGIGTQPADDLDVVTRFVPAERRTAASLVALLVGGAVAAVTVDRALDTAVSLIRVVATLDVSRVVTADVAVMVAFFVSFAVATKALDRLVVDAVRGLVVD